MSKSSITASPAAAAGSGPLGLLPIPGDSNPWTTNTNAVMGLDAFVDQFYDANSRNSEISSYRQRGFVGGATEGWFNFNGSQQSVTIVRFASATGAGYAYTDLSGSFRQVPSPSTVFTDSADGAVGTSDPTLDSEGDAFVDVTAHIGDYLVEVQEFSANKPRPSDAETLLQKQVDALKG